VKKIEAKDAEHLRNLEAVMNTRAGMEVIKSIFKASNAFKPEYSEDHSAMAFREGARSIGLALFSDLSRIQHKGSASDKFNANFLVSINQSIDIHIHKNKKEEG